MAAAGVGAFLHSRATTKGALAVWGTVDGLSSVAALAMGILLAGWLRTSCTKARCSGQ